MKHQDLLRETYIEINLDRIEHNIRAIREMCGPSTNIGAVVKADAYGHGAVALAPVLMENGADLLCVATLSEGIELKQHFPNYPVLLMGLTRNEYFDDVLHYHLIQTIDTFEQAAALSQSAVKHKQTAHIHIKIDTGFHRLGFLVNEESIDQIEAISHLPNIVIDGIFTHLVLLDNKTNEEQFQLFLSVKETLDNRNIHIPCWHIADSIAGVDYPQYRMDGIRAGAILYGLKGFHKGELELRQAISFKSRINHITHIRAGEGVSYDFTWRAEKDTQIATLPFGYADGYPRNMHGKGWVTLHGKRVPIVGVICMDQCMVDLYEVPEACVGDEVIIYGDGSANTMSIQEAALLAETNKNDIVSRLTRRPPRVYTRKGEMVKVSHFFL
ncbi:MAG: alanine racemase [Lachnospiraceae bacterium]|nr:alanine racemase [Lachnospiraceae bacterium]